MQGAHHQLQLTISPHLTSQRNNTHPSSPQPHSPPHNAHSITIAPNATIPDSTIKMPPNPELRRQVIAVYKGYCPTPHIIHHSPVPLNTANRDSHQNFSH